jgi:predicted nuclease of restriction endonuclease-like (RecB) superfamily
MKKLDFFMKTRLLNAAERERLPGKSLPPDTILKSPYVLEFLGLPDSPSLHEKKFDGRKLLVITKY